MELRGILEQQAGYVRASGATVTVESRYPTVAIDGDGVDVFMQGEEADACLDEADKTWRKAGTLGLDVVYEALAAPYVRVGMEAPRAPHRESRCRDPSPNRSSYARRRAKEWTSRGCLARRG